MKSPIQILDCTLRDGGLGLEDAAKNGLSSKKFTTEKIDKIIGYLNESNLDIIELGSIEITDKDMKKYAIYQNIESVSKTIPENRNKDQLYVALYRGPDTPIEDIPSWNPALCDGIRVILRYSELQKSLDFCAALAKKGYKVFVQPMLTMRYTDEELQRIIKASNEMGAYALYFVDSYGYMMEEDIVRFFKIYHEGLNPSIRIGFHAHNNMNLAFSNVLSFLKIKTERNIIVDSCILGMGQGAGNMQTELLASQFLEKYCYESILQICEIIEEYLEDNLWGYSVTRMLSAIHKVAYKYSVALRNQYRLTYVEIHRIFSSMDEELKQRYTIENTKNLLKSFHYEHLI